MNKLNLLLAVITLLVAGLVSMATGISESIQLPVFIASVLILGIPHGATDHLISFVYHGDSSKEGFKKFLNTTLALMAFYAIMWYLVPPVALVIFLIISFYHFGQSQLYYAEKYVHSEILNKTLYILWGASVIGLMICTNLAEAYAILDPIVPLSEQTIFLIAKWTTWVSVTIFGILLLSLLIAKILPFRNFLTESAILLVLGVLIASTPLLIAFSIYFALWHSLKSIIVEISVIRKKIQDFNLLAFYKTALPMSLISFAGIVLIIYLNQVLAHGLPPLTIFFVLLSILTFPHIFSIESLFRLRLQK